MNKKNINNIAKNISTFFGCGLVFSFALATIHRTEAVVISLIIWAAAAIIAKATEE